MRRAKSGPQLFEWRARDKSGKVFWVEVNLKPCVINGEDRILAVVRNITDRKRMEGERLEMARKLLDAQKLESLGIMAGGIAHDFNNQLAVVLGNLELALMDLAPDSVVRPSIQNAVEAAKRSAELLDRYRYTRATLITIL